jgi:hypothetical protein
MTTATDERVSPELLDGPRCRGMLGDSHVHDATAFVTEDDEDEQQTTGRSRPHKEPQP